MPRLNKQQRAIRALKDLRDLGIIDQVKESLGKRCLSCQRESVDQLRARAALADDFLVELTELAESGELTYNE